MLPWGTPCSCLNMSDRVVPTLTGKPLPLRKFSMKMGSLPRTPNSCNSRIIPYFHVVWNELGKLAWMHMTFLGNIRKSYAI